MKVITSYHPNIITQLSTSIDNTAKLPLTVIRGSEKERYAIAGKYAKELRVGLDKVSETRECKVEDFKNLINNILAPNKINFKIEPLISNFNLFQKDTGSIGIDSEYLSSVTPIGSVVIDSTHKINKGYTIKLPLSQNNTVINDKYSAYHEARHLFDYICNPKTIDSNLFRVIDNEKKNKAFLNTYKTFISDTNIFGGKKYIKHVAGKNLKKLSDEEAIGCLQNIRHTLKTEINAYRDTADYMREKPIMNCVHIYGGNEFLFLHNYPKRLTLANQMLADRLKQARDKTNKNSIKY